jgi:hypothetical protein
MDGFLFNRDSKPAPMQNRGVRGVDRPIALQLVLHRIRCVSLMRVYLT